MIVYFLIFFFFLLSVEQVYAELLNLVPFASGFSDITTVTNAGDDRLFVVEQSGLIKVVSSQGVVNPVSFLDIRDRVDDVGFEEGLLGLAFHPQYQSNGYFFVYYTALDGTSRLSRFQVSKNQWFADANSETIVLTIDQPYQNHNGGALEFGPDAYLYLGLGDGGSGGDPQNNAQNGTSLLGKIVRLDVSISASGGYSLPPDNPYLSDPGILDEIWSLGLRNPWKFSFDRMTGDLWIADVGQNLLEEINYQSVGSSGGENYGWRCYEADAAYNLSNCGPATNYVFPVHQYSHNPHCSVTGGRVYRGLTEPRIRGHYFFADYCSGAIWSLTKEGDNFVFHEHDEILQGVTTFGENNSGDLFVASKNDGTLYQIRQELVETPAISFVGILIIIAFISLIFYNTHGSM